MTPRAEDVVDVVSIKAARCWPTISDVTKMSVLPVLLLLLCISSSLTQTFQYSQGWTNGRKRSASATSVSPLQEIGLSDAQHLPSEMVKAFEAAWKRTLTDRKVSSQCISPTSTLSCC